MTKQALAVGVFLTAALAQAAGPADALIQKGAAKLEAGDANLTADQRDRLVTALAEERKRVPAPKLSESVSREEYNREMAAWQDDYNQRAATRASSILNSEQQNTYTEFQQLSREMRQQMEQRRAAREAGGPPGTQPGPPLR